MAISDSGAAGPAAGAAAPDVKTAAPPWSRALSDLWTQLPGLLNDRIELLSLELQRAGAALVQVVILIVAAAILGVTAWLVLWGAVVIALVAAGLHLAWALAAALLINVAAAFWAVARVRRLLPLLRLPATRRHLMITPSPTPRSPTPPQSSFDTDERIAPSQPVSP